MTPEESISRGVRARQILEDDLFREAWEGMERGAVERLAACDVTDAKTLQALTLALQTVRKTRAIFAAWVSEGKAAADRQQRAEEGARPWGERIQQFRHRR